MLCRSRGSMGNTLSMKGICRGWKCSFWEVFLSFMCMQLLSSWVTVIWHALSYPQGLSVRSDEDEGHKYGEGTGPLDEYFYP